MSCSSSRGKICLWRSRALEQAYPYRSSYFANPIELSLRLRTMKTLWSTSEFVLSLQACRLTLEQKSFAEQGPRISNGAGRMTFEAEVLSATDDTWMRCRDCGSSRLVEVMIGLISMAWGVWGGG